MEKLPEQLLYIDPSLYNKNKTLNHTIIKKEYEETIKYYNGLRKLVPSLPLFVPLEKMLDSNNNIKNNNMIYILEVINGFSSNQLKLLYNENGSINKHSMCKIHEPNAKNHLINICEICNKCFFVEKLDKSIKKINEQAEKQAEIEFLRVKVPSKNVENMYNKIINYPNLRKFYEELLRLNFIVIQKATDKKNELKELIEKDNKEYKDKLKEIRDEQNNMDSRALVKPTKDAHPDLIKRYEEFKSIQFNAIQKAIDRKNKLVKQINMFIDEYEKISKELIDEERNMDIRTAIIKKYGNTDEFLAAVITDAEFRRYYNKKINPGELLLLTKDEAKLRNKTNLKYLKYKNKYLQLKNKLNI